MYITKLIRDFNIGAISPTPKNIIDKMFAHVDFEMAKIVVEFGPGGGVITKQLLKNLQPNARLFVFETNKEFIKELEQIKDNRLKIINADALLFKQKLQEDYQVLKVDYIFSTIPFSFFEEEKRSKIIKLSYDVLNKNGKFITYQYSKLLYKYLKKQFQNTQLDFTLKNIFPSFIMVGIKK